MKHWKNFAAFTGGLFTVSSDDKVRDQKTRKILRKVSLRGCSRGEMCRPSAVRTGVYGLSFLRHAIGSWLWRTVPPRLQSAVKGGRSYRWANCSRVSAAIVSQQTG